MTEPVGPIKTHHYWTRAASLRGVRQDIKRVEGFNAKLALLITGAVGSMACAYLFGLLAFAGLPAALKPGGIGLLFWISSDFLQLTLLSVIIVGQNVQAKAADARSEATWEDTVKILDALDCKTEGGLKEILDAIAALPPKDG